MCPAGKLFGAYNIGAPVDVDRTAVPEYGADSDGFRWHIRGGRGAGYFLLAGWKMSWHSRNTAYFFSFMRGGGGNSSGSVRGGGGVGLHCCFSYKRVMVLNSSIIGFVFSLRNDQGCWVDMGCVLGLWKTKCVAEKLGRVPARGIYYLPIKYI